MKEFNDFTETSDFEKKRYISTKPVNVYKNYLSTPYQRYIIYLLARVISIAPDEGDRIKEGLNNTGGVGCGGCAVGVSETEVVVIYSL